MTREEAIDRVLIEAIKTLGMKEQPKGSNKGEILVFGGKGGPWCCAWVCEIWHRGTGEWPASCGFTRGTGTLWSAAKRDGRHSYVPQRGDIFYKPRYEKGKRVGGHVGFVEYVDGKQILTIEGNLNDAVRRGRRDAKDCIGFVRPRVPEGAMGETP